MMKKLLCLGGIILFASIQLAHAQTERVRYDLDSAAGKADIYLSLRGGGFFQNATDSAYGDAIGSIGGALGIRIDFGRSHLVPIAAIRLEVEGSYLLEKEEIVIENNTTHRFDASGYVVLGSLLIDLRTEHALKPYLVLSGGYRKPSLDFKTGGQNFKSDASSLLGGGGGLAFSLNKDDSVLFDVDYRYLHALKEDHVGDSHAILAGFRFIDK